MRYARFSRRQPFRRRRPPAPARSDSGLYVAYAPNMPIVHANCFTATLRGQVSKLAYAWEKLLELPQCEKKRLYLIASGVDIYRTQIARELRPISFSHLRPIHIVTDQAGTSAKMQARAQKLREFAQSLLPGQTVTSVDIDRLMPSVTPFRAVEDEDGNFILFEGVGRYNAIREALGEEAALDISVEVFRTKDPARTLRLVHDVQRANGLRPGLPGPLLDLIGPANSSNPGFLAQVWDCSDPRNWPPVRFWLSCRPVGDRPRRRT